MFHTRPFNMMTKVIDDTPVQVFIDNGAMSSILPFSTYIKYPILHNYPKTKSITPMHTRGGTTDFHFWIDLPLKLDNQTIQIKALVCDSQFPYDILIGRTSLAHLSVWQDYSTNSMARLFHQQTLHAADFDSNNH